MDEEIKKLILEQGAKIDALTEELKSLKASVSKEKPVDEVTIKEDEDLVIVSGKTYKLRTKIKEFGGVWNKSKKIWEIGGDIDEIGAKLRQEASDKGINVKME